MPRFVALFRGINVGRAKRIAMADLRALAPTGGAEQLHVGPHAAYLWCAGGILESKLATPLLKGLAECGTTRNRATVEKINAMLQEAA